jgi:hypothetical protein
VNRRRSALATTSTSSTDFAPLLPVSIFHSLLALYTKLFAGKCLIYIGREGRPKKPTSLAWRSIVSDCRVDQFNAGLK